MGSSFSIKRVLLMFSFISIILMGCVLQEPMYSRAASETSRTNYTISSGVTESTVYITDSNNNNVRAHILRVNDGANVSFKVSTKSYYSKNSTKASRKNYAKSWSKSKWGFATVEKQASNYESSKDKEGSVIAASNGDFYVKNRNGETMGTLIMEGNTIKRSTSFPYFAILNDGTPVIRTGSADTSDVSEAISGNRLIISDGTNLGSKVADGNTVQAIGVTKDKTIVLINVDGREPSSVGSSLYDIGVVMLRQGCENAMLLDCGGSASFLTKRSGDKSVKLRNVPNDGVARGVSSSLLIVRNSKSSGKTPSGEATVSMKDSDTYLKKSGSKYRYVVNGKGLSGFHMVNNSPYLFGSNGYGLSKTVTIGKTKYTFKGGKLTKVSDKKAGKVALGFCGANNDGKNLIYTYQYGNQKLNVGKNPMIKKNSGKMENWGNIIDVPWQAVKHKVKAFVTGKGVKNIGSFALYISLHPFEESLKNMKPKLKSVSISSTVNTIGTFAFFNQTSMKKVTIPKNVKKIEVKTFSYSNGTTYVFKRKNPPTIQKDAFYRPKNYKKLTIKTPKTKAWKKYRAKKATMKKIGFKGNKIK